VSALALALRDVHKRFDTTVALDGARCEVRPGTVHALLGENGAGKTTLMRIAFGMLAPDGGTVVRDGRALPHADQAAAIAAGIGMVHQHFMLVPALTVAENAALGGRGRFDPREAAARVQRVAAATGLTIDPDERVRDLPVGAQQRAELVRALAHDATLLILDEPTAVLTPLESDELYRWMRRFAETGGTVILITHKLGEALAVADDVTVLRRGRTVLEGRAAAVGEDTLVTAIVGHAPAAVTEPPVGPSAGEPLFELDAAGWADAHGVMRLQPTTLTVRRGEILGVLGVEGSGERELLRLLAGRLAPSVGRLRRPSRVGFIPGDRLQDAIIPGMTLVENHALAEAAALRGLMAWETRGAATGAVLTSHDVRAAGPAATMASLSGGNQQRFVVGREHQLAPEALVAENPTRGLDVRAAAQVWTTLRAVARDGGAVVVHSTDLDEILAVTRRVVVCFAGTVREIVPPDDPSDRGPYARALLGVAG
jgi:ABC-type uncharacterized transport system ATPase subunit